MAKQKTGKPETSARVIKQTLTKSALIDLIAEQNDIPRKTAIGVFNTLESVMLGSIHPRGVGEFTLPGLFKITLRKVPARLRSLWTAAIAAFFVHLLRRNGLQLPARWMVQSDANCSPRRIP